MTEIKKFKEIKVDGKNDKKYFFKFKPLFNVGNDEFICETRCSYGDICNKIRDPRNIEDPESCFEDFCGELGEEDDPENVNLIPVPGSIEEGFKDTTDIFQDLIKSNPTIRLKDMIEKVCATGWCEDYNKDHTNCTSANQSCLFHDLFIKTIDSNGVTTTEEEKK